MMHLFADYVQPLTLWLYTHPDWALFITFLISFCESLAIIGSIIPGSITMTAIGILAGSGIMRIDLTFLAAILGAIAGDGGSYALGYTFSDRIIGIWPFRKYPDWIAYGKDYFSKHGATSIFIGRFVGPMRSIIPVIAGMMHMNHWHFFLANCISGVAWSILYITPGLLIGAGSSELSTDTSTRLYLLILALLITIWVTSLGLKWLFIHSHQFFRAKLHDGWIWLNQCRSISLLTRRLTPFYETNHATTAALMITLIFSFLISFFLVGLAIQSTIITPINGSILHFSQSFHTEYFDLFFSLAKLAISPLPLITLFIALLTLTLYHQDWYTLRYWILLSVLTTISLFLLTKTIWTPNIDPAMRLYNTSSFPDPGLTFATTFLVFYILVMGMQSQSLLIYSINGLIFVFLCLTGTGLIYLGSNWFVSIIGSYFIGLTLSLLFWMGYRRQKPVHQYPKRSLVLPCCLMALAIAATSAVNLKKIIELHCPHIKQLLISDADWWNQKRPILPIYSTNRMGKPVGFLNIQYVGSIDTLKTALETAGWKERPVSILYSLLWRVSDQKSVENHPLMIQLYQNKKPELVMIFSDEKAHPPIVLRLWLSNYHIKENDQHIWIGSAGYLFSITPNDSNALHYAPPVHERIKKTLNGFEFNPIKIPKLKEAPCSKASNCLILLIKEPVHIPQGKHI